MAVFEGARDDGVRVYEIVFGLELGIAIGVGVVKWVAYQLRGFIPVHSQG